MVQMSWHAHLRERGEYSRWVDQGSPSISHHRFGRYLLWVQERARDGVAYEHASVTRIDLCDDRWLIEIDHGKGAPVSARGLLLTGPGRPRPLPGSANIDIPHGGDTRQRLVRDIHESAHVLVVGGGESAAAAALTVLDQLGPHGTVSLLTPGWPRRRAELHPENSVYSDPEGAGWLGWEVASRREFIRRTDRGVVSGELLDRLNWDERVRFVLGRLESVSRSGDAFEVVVLRQDAGSVACVADVVVNCTGFQIWPMLDSLLTAKARRSLISTLGPVDDAVLAESIDEDLAVAGLPARLFLPGLAGLSVGPGFANLSSLGALSDRILDGLLRVGVEPEVEHDAVLG
jgi:mycobactin lysine-N-oxygenase